MAALPTPWLSNPLRYRTRLYCGSKQSGLSDKDMRILPPDLEAIVAATDRWAQERGVDVDPFFAHRELAAWDEPLRPHSPGELFHMNSSALSVTDGGIIHDFDGGSTMLGTWLGRLLDNPRRLPVLVLAHRSEKVSKALEGATETYPNLTMATFDDPTDLGILVGRWLATNEQALVNGPHRRMLQDQTWRTMGKLVATAWDLATPATRDAVLQALPYSEDAITDMLSEPHTLDERAAGNLMTLLTVLQVDLARATTAQEARLLLDPAEVTAWRHWSDAHRPDYAWWALTAVLTDRKEAGVFREQDFLGQPGTWERYAAEQSARRDQG